jgi:hypothetical protein
MNLFKNIFKFKCFTLLVISVLTFNVAFSQRNYVSGYVIKNDNDTLIGLIDFRNWVKNPNKISFKPLNSNSSISLKPSDIIEFGTQGNIYVSGVVKTEISTRKTDELENDPHLKLKTDTTFLQTLIKGSRSLYYYNNSHSKKNFYIKQDSVFELLLYKKYYKQDRGMRLMVENKNYLGQLNIYLNDCQSIKQKLENTSYNKKSLTELFNYYYQCTPSQMYFQNAPEKIEAQFGVIAGLSLTSLKFHSTAFSYLVKADYSKSTNFSSGIFLDLILPRNLGKWSIYNEILFSSYKVSGTASEYRSENEYTITTTEFENSYLKINNLIRYKHPIGSISIFVNGGISNGYSINERNYQHRFSKLYTIERVTEELALNDTRKYEQGFILGSGVNYKHFSMELRLEKGNGMAEYITLNSETTRYFLLFGYRF